MPEQNQSQGADRTVLKVRHVTTYNYSQPVPYGLAKLRLRPRNDTTQTVSQWRVDIEGGKVSATYTDEHGNVTDLLEIESGTTKLEIIADGVVQTLRNDGLADESVAPPWLYSRPTPLTTAGESVKDLCQGFDFNKTLASLHTLSASILERVPFDLTVNTAADSAEAVLARKAGVCQDHTHVMLAAARHLGFPARYVSGHLALNQGVDQTAGHAWAEILVPNLGWVGFDISNGYSPDNRYMRLAVGRDAREAAPIDGLIFGNHREQLDVAVRVESVQAQQ